MVRMGGAPTLGGGMKMGGGSGAAVFDKLHEILQPEDDAEYDSDGNPTGRTAAPTPAGDSPPAATAPAPAPSLTTAADDAYARRVGGKVADAAAAAGYTDDHFLLEELRSAAGVAPAQKGRVDPAFARAENARFERELYEKYGPLKGFVLHPWTRRASVEGAKLAKCFSPFPVLGNALLPFHTVVILLFVGHRSKVSYDKLALFACVMLSVNPVLVLAAVGAWQYVLTAKHAPKGRASKVRERCCRGGAARRRRGVGAGVGTRPTPPSHLSPPTPTPPLPQAALAKALAAETRFTDATPLHAKAEPDALAAAAADADAAAYVVVGSDPAAMYTAAVLSQLGHKCVVLEPSAFPGGGVVQPSDRPYRFDVGNHGLGRLAQFADVLAPAVALMRAPLDWAPLGDDEDGNVHTIASVAGSPGLSVFPAGAAGFADAVVRLAPGERIFADSFVQQAMAIKQHGFTHFVKRSCGALFAKAVDVMGASVYSTAGAQPTLTMLARFCKDKDEEILRALAAQFRAENLPVEKVAFGAYLAHLSDQMDGQHYPAGGPRGLFEAMAPAVVAAGGKVLTGAKAVALHVEGGAVRGVRVAAKGGGTVVVRAALGVVSSAGVLQTFNDLLPKEALDAAGGLPAGVAACEPSRPVRYTVVGLAGGAEELELPTADYHEMADPLDAAASDDHAAGRGPKGGEAGGWMRVAFPSAKDPAWPFDAISTCVVTTEADDEYMDLHAKLDAPDSTESARARARVAIEAYDARFHDRVRARLAALFPAAAAAIEYLASVKPQRRGLAATGARHAARGLQPKTSVPGLWLTGTDLTYDCPAGALLSGWLTAHAIAGYSGWDVLFWRRSLVKDLGSWRG